MRKAYTLLLYLALPAVFAYLSWRGLRDRGWLHRWPERLGRVPLPPAPGGIVIHAASFGEVNAAAPLVSAIMKDRPGTPLTITTFTPTGSRRVRELFGEQVHHVYAPIDLPGAVKRSFRRLQPRLLVIMETEIWPNLLRKARRRGTPVILVNARLSESSVRGYARAPALVAEALSGLTWIGAQSPSDAERLIACGARARNITVTGNLKFDIRVAPTLANEAADLRRRWGAERPVLTAGSTRPEDEDVLIPAFARIREQVDGALLILAPRHPERFEESARKAGRAGLRVALRSDGEACRDDTDCFVIDSMGELMRYYACSDVAFVGGTFADVGGHNLLEPAALSRPVLFGPHTYNTEQVASALEESGGGKRLHSGDELVTTATDWLQNPDTRQQLGRAAFELVESGRGSLELTHEAIRTIMNRA